jgi:hypothetical protein
MKNEQGTFKQLKVKAILSDHRFQRDVGLGRMEAMSKSLDWTVVGCPVVSERSNGKHYAIDGQHRLGAIDLAGFGDRDILCEVVNGLTLDEEAGLYRRLNRNRLGIASHDDFKAALVEGDKTAVEVNDIVTAAGLKIGKSTASRTICAVRSLVFVHTHKKTLAKTLDVLTAWSDDSGAYEGSLIRAIGSFLAHYPQATTRELTRKLAPWAPDRLVYKIRRTASEIGPRDAAIETLLEIYNHGLRKNRLARRWDCDEEPLAAE